MTEAMGYKCFTTIGGVYYEFVTHGVTGMYELLDDEDGIRGTRSRTLERAAQGLFKGGGDIHINPTPLELSGLYPLMVNATTGGALSDAMQDVTLILDLITKKNTYTGRFSKFTLRGSPGKKLDLTATYVAKSLAEGATSLSGIPDITVRPYMMQDMGTGITIGGVTYSLAEFELEIDNHIVPTYMQGQAPTDLEPQDRTVRLRVKTKYNTAEAALQTLALSGPALGSPITGTLAFTNGTNSVSFAFAAMVAVPKAVMVQNKGPLRWDGDFHCYKSGTTNEIITTFA